MITVNNKENDCELLSEFNDAFKNNFLINQINQTFNSDQLVKLDQTVNNKPTKISLSSQNFESQPALNNNCPPKPPSRTKSTSKLNKTQNDLDNVNNLKKLNSHESAPQKTLDSTNCSTIKIINQPLNYSNSNLQQKNERNSDENKLIKSNLSNLNYGENESNSFNLTGQLNKLIISVQANDKEINLEQTKLVNCKNDYQLEHMKSDLEKEQQQMKISIPDDSFKSIKKPSSNNGLWSSSSNDLNKDKSKINRIKFNNELIQNKFDIEQQVVKRSKTTHLDTRPLNSIIKNNNLDKSLLDKSNNILKERSVNESIDKLVHKSISRLASKRNQVSNNETVRNKSCSSLYQTMNSSPDCEIMKRSRIPTSKSSVHLSKPDRRSADFVLTSYSEKVLTDNCLGVSSSSSCSLCTSKSLSTDSLDSLTRKDSSRSSSLSNLNSSLDNCDFNRLKTSSSTSRMIRPTAVRFGAINNAVKSPINSSSNYSFRLDGTRSLSNLTNYQLMNYNKKLSKTNSNNHFYPIRELSRIDESIDDDQEQQSRQERNIDYVTKFRKNDDKLNEFKFINSTNQPIKTSSNAYDSNACSSTSSTTFSPLTNRNSNLTFTNSDTNSLISSSLDLDAHCMDSSDHLTINKSSNLSTITNITNTTNTNTSSSSTKPSLNQFKSSLINQLIDSNSHLKNNICIDNEQSSINDCKLDNQLNGSLVNFGKRLDNDIGMKIKENDFVNDNKLKDVEIVNDDLSDSNELSLIENLNDTQKNMFNSKKLMFAKNKSSLISKDSCRSFELNERIVELEMQLMSHKTKFKESLNLIKLLSDHCNDLIEVFNENYNCKLNELNKLVNENQRLIKMNQQIKLENKNLNETCDDLTRALRNQNIESNINNAKDDQSLFYKDQAYRELEEMYREKTEELNNLKAKFKQNNELYERVKSKAMEKVER